MVGGEIFWMNFCSLWVVAVAGSSCFWLGVWLDKNAKKNSPCNIPHTWPHAWSVTYIYKSRTYNWKYNNNTLIQTYFMLCKNSIIKYRIWFVPLFSWASLSVFFFFFFFRLFCFVLCCFTGRIHQSSIRTIKEAS